MWEKLGYKVLGIIPKVARLKGVEGLVDAKQYYYDLTTVTEYSKQWRTQPCFLFLFYNNKCLIIITMDGQTEGVRVLWLLWGDVACEEQYDIEYRLNLIGGRRS